MKKPRLAKDLERVASRIFKRTRGIILPDYRYEQIGLMASTYGAGAVLEDFESWADSADSGIKYPISEYLRVVDERLGQKANEEHPGIVEVVAFVYDLVGDIPPKSIVRKLLESNDVNDITEAFGDFVGGLDEEQTKTAIKKFFQDGGAEAIISKLKGK